MADKTPLDQVKGITAELMARMKSLNITCVEELIAYHTAIGEDISTLTAALDIGETELELIIEQAKKVLPEAVLRELTTAPPEEEMPFGARKPEDLD